MHTGARAKKEVGEKGRWWEANGEDPPAVAETKEVKDWFDSF